MAVAAHGSPGGGPRSTGGRPSICIGDGHFGGSDRCQGIRELPRRSDLVGESRKRDGEDGFHGDRDEA